MTSTNKGYALIDASDNELSFEQRLQLTSKNIPALKRGQVLINVLASPVNPSDLVYLMGKYGVPPQLGNFAGFEGCGEVVEANAGLYGKYLTGKRVAFFTTPGLDGCWAEQVVTGAGFCLPLRDDIPDNQGATVIVNPLTSVCLVDRAIALGAKGVLINAAASQVGKGCIRYCQQKGLKVIATVRSQSNVSVLEELGADKVVLTTAEDYQRQLKEACKTHQATVLFDAVASEDTAICMKAMPANSTGIVYGRLTDTHHEFGGEYSVADMIFRNQKIEGFWLSTVMKKLNPWQVYKLSQKVQKLFAQGIFQTDIQGEYGFEDFINGLTHYAEHKSDGKVILTPHRR